MVDATKFTKIDELKASGKAASISAESFVQQQSGLATTVQQHEETISLLTHNYKTLEQQVKAIARVMASQNIQKLSENMKLAQDELQRNLMQYVNEKNKDIILQVERELSDVTDAKTGLGKKIDAVEQNIMTVVGAKLEEASAARYANREEIEKIKDMIDNVPDTAQKNAKLLRQLDAKVTDLKAEFRNFEKEHESANIEQDKQVAALSSEIRNKLELAGTKLADESKALSKSIRRHESLVEDKVKNLSDMIEKETKDRIEMCKSFPALIVDSVGNVRAELEKKFQTVELDVDRKVKPFVSSIQEIKRLIDEEAVHREAADAELTRNLNKEIKDRNHDEEHLLGLISTCQATVGKMHKVS
eukprot:TRINITY_DN1110_c0_g5_i1.p1 TRINITY_DN1110_c0_g5~~TRINITY_DN1110_c0_g5_i1.p1  ORF type:complete len:360 (+),score=123.04 TRINITY_DN1110_c0_g5_i1:69-1148(+)